MKKDQGNVGTAMLLVTTSIFVLNQEEIYSVLGAEGKAQSARLVIGVLQKMEIRVQ